MLPAILKMHLNNAQSIMRLHSTKHNFCFSSVMSTVLVHIGPQAPLIIVSYRPIETFLRNPMPESIFIYFRLAISYFARFAVKFQNERKFADTKTLLHRVAFAFPFESVKRSITR